MTIGRRTCSRSAPTDPAVTCQVAPSRKSPTASAVTPSTPSTPEIVPTASSATISGSDSLHTTS